MSISDGVPGTDLLVSSVGGGYEIDLLVGYRESSIDESTGGDRGDPRFYVSLGRECDPVYFTYKNPFSKHLHVTFHLKIRFKGETFTM